MTATSTRKWTDSARTGKHACLFIPRVLIKVGHRAHRIGQIRDVHIYRFVSKHTVEEALLRKANQKRSLDDLVIQKGEFDWRSLFNDETALTKALGEFEDTEDAHAAAVAAREEVVMEGADEVDFAGDAGDVDGVPASNDLETQSAPAAPEELEPEEDLLEDAEDAEEDGGTTDDYMIAFVNRDYDFFRDWRL